MIDETTLQSLKQDIESIMARNNQVETDKAWETSLTRKAVIALSTFIVIWAYMEAIGVSGAFLHALVPASAFLLSTLTLPCAKKMWMEKICK